MASHDPPTVRARLAVALGDLVPDMIIQCPENHRWMRIESIGNVVGDRREARVAYTGGRTAGKPFAIVLHHYANGYQTRPHFGLLEPGDIIRFAHKRIVVDMVSRDRHGMVTMNGVFYRRRHSGDSSSIAQRYETRRYALESVTVLEWSA